MSEKFVTLQIDPVAVLFENLFFAPDSQAAKAHLKRFLAREIRSRAWVLKVLVDGVSPVKISKPRLKAMLLERVESWEWENSLEFIGDFNETFARLWPAEESNRASVFPVDWPGIEKRLYSASGSEIDSALAEVLNRLHEPSRWLLVSLFLRRMNWGLLRQDVFSVLDDLSGVEAGFEAYWHYLKDHPENLGRLCSGGGIDVEIEKGASFRVTDRPVSMNWEDVLKLKADDFEYTRCVAGEWVQCCATKIETNLYRSDGELLNTGFPDLLDSVCTAGRCTAVLHAKGENQEAFDNRLLAARGKRRVKHGDSSLKSIELTLLDGDRLFADGGQSSGFRVVSASWAAVESWDALKEIPPQQLFLRRNPNTDGSGAAWVKVLAPARKVLVGFLYAEKSKNSRSFASFTVGLRNGDGQWLPLAKVDSRDVGLLEVDRFEDWAKANAVMKRGPIVEFRKEIVMEISFTGVVAAPRRKCGLNLENPLFQRIVWENRIEDLLTLEDFVQKCEQSGGFSR